MYPIHHLHTAPHMELLKGSSSLQWMKLAVAVAIIRTKPQGMASRTHAEKLRSQFFLAQSKLQLPKCRSSNDGEECSSAAVSRNIYDDNAGPDMVMTPPPSSETTSGLNMHAKTLSHGARHQLSEYSIANVQFTNNLMELQRLSCQPWAGEYEVECDAVCSYLHTLRTVLERDLAMVSTTNQCEVANTITGLLSKRPWLVEDASVMQSVCGFIDWLVHNLTIVPTDPSQYPPHRQKNTFVNMVCIFMQCGVPALIMSVMGELQESIEMFCNTLRQCLTLQVLPDPDILQNSYFTLHSLERAFSNWHQQGHCPVSAIKLHEMQTKLEGCLQGISQQYPLLAQSIWKITSLIETFLQNR